MYIGSSEKKSTSRASGPRSEIWKLSGKSANQPSGLGVLSMRTKCSPPLPPRPVGLARAGRLHKLTSRFLRGVQLAAYGLLVGAGAAQPPATEPDIPGDIVAQARPHWPRSAPLLAQLDGVPAGHQAAWVRAGANAGVRVGDAWWITRDGQPVFALETVAVCGTRSFCLLTPLARGATVRTNDVVAAWPAPGLARIGEANSAVSFIEPDTGGHAGLLWIPRPPNVLTPEEPRFEIVRQGEFIAFAQWERSDALFWYARPSPSLARGPIEVGDAVRVLTTAQVETGNWTARVFELRPADSGQPSAPRPPAALITAGDVEGLRWGQRLYVVRDGAPNGQASVTRAQHGYTEIVRESPPGEPFQVGDVVSPLPPSSPSRRVGRIARVLSDRNTHALEFTAELESTSGVPQFVEIQRAGKFVGVGWIRWARDRQAGGFVLETGSVRAALPGDELYAEAP